MTRTDTTTSSSRKSSDSTITTESTTKLLSPPCSSPTKDGIPLTVHVSSKGPLGIGIAMNPQDGYCMVDSIRLLNSELGQIVKKGDIVKAINSIPLKPFDGLDVWSTLVRQSSLSLFDKKKRIVELIRPFSNQTQETQKVKQTETTPTPTTKTMTNLKDASPQTTKSTATITITTNASTTKPTTTSNPSHSSTMTTAIATLPSTNSTKVTPSPPTNVVIASHNSTASTATATTTNTMSSSSRPSQPVMIDLTNTMSSPTPTKKTKTVYSQSASKAPPSSMTSNYPYTTNHTIHNPTNTTAPPIVADHNIRMKASTNPTKFPPPPPPSTKKSTKKRTYNNTQKSDPVEVVEIPPPGFVCSKKQYYSTLSHETPTDIAAKLGCSSYRDIIQVQENIDWYGKSTLKSNSLLKKGTLIRMPPIDKLSQFQIQKLINIEWEELQILGTCIACHKSENPNDPNDPPMLMCDGCDAACHLAPCAPECTVIPKGEWFCPTCLDILHERKQQQQQQQQGPSTTIHNGNKVIVLSPTLQQKCHQVTRKLHHFLQEQRQEEYQILMESLQLQKQDLQESLHQLEQDLQSLQTDLRFKQVEQDNIHSALCQREGIRSFTPKTITLLTGQTLVEKDEILAYPFSSYIYRHTEPLYTVRWKVIDQKRQRILKHSALIRAQNQVKECKGRLERLQNTIKDTTKELTVNCDKEYQKTKLSIQLRYAALLQEPQLHVKQESNKAFQNREASPHLLGFVTLQESKDIMALEYLQEPTPIIYAIPVNDENETTTTTILSSSLQVGSTYGIFARDLLFDLDRDDELPLTSSLSTTTSDHLATTHTIPSSRSIGSARNAQKHLMKLLLRHSWNQGIVQVIPSKVPPSVQLRGTNDDNDGLSLAALQCYDLSALVRDCNYDIESSNNTTTASVPKAPTPSSLAKHGLQLREYQQCSLQWMLDKEKESSTTTSHCVEDDNGSSMGFASELWSKCQTLSSSSEKPCYYYYCELTGTFSRSIFDHHKEAQQPTASQNSVALPSGGILGEEMGLGKTIICLSLIVSNPPAKHYRLLPREHMLGNQVSHDAYVYPPTIHPMFGAKKKTTNTVSKNKMILYSNGTLVVAPVTLCSQWKSEISKFAPFLRVLTIHHADTPTLQEVASADIVIVSTFVLSQAQSSSKLFTLIKKLHWHRLIVDESHYNQQGQRTQQSLAMISSTYRWCSTGTPVGHSLDDLHGQLRFLRIPQFTREAFWKNHIDDGYYNHNDEALRVLRSLLSRVVIRHSKEQTTASGKAMLSLPPRNIMTEFLTFGSQDEQNVYEALEKRIQDRFLELRRQSPDKVLSKYIELTSMMLGARQACSHSSMIDLFKIERLNRALDLERERFNIENGISEDKYKNKKQSSNKVKGSTRESILKEAIEKALPSAENHVRHTIRQFQEGEIEFMECPICLDPFDEIRAAITPCGHPFCSECILAILDQGSYSREPRGNCPQCRNTIKRSELVFLGEAQDAGKKSTTSIEDNGAMESQTGKSSTDNNGNCGQINGFKITTKDMISTTSLSTTRRVTHESMSKEDRTWLQCHLSTIAPGFLHNFDVASQSIGSKVSRLLEEIQIMSRKDSTSKCVVFSQFIGILDVASQEMAARGIRFVRVDGSMKQHERADALSEFSNNPQVKVFLLSMRAGAVGLTLTAADHCFILDVPTNPAVEEQAIDRIHRIGQTRPVSVKRFIMKGTVEERILSARRSLVSEGAGTQLDGTATIEGDTVKPSAAKKARTDAEAHFTERRFERLKMLETLFGITTTMVVAKS